MPCEVSESPSKSRAWRYDDTDRCAWFQFHCLLQGRVLPVKMRLIVISMIKRAVGRLIITHSSKRARYVFPFFISTRSLPDPLCNLLIHMMILLCWEGLSDHKIGTVPNDYNIRYLENRVFLGLSNGNMPVHESWRHSRMANRLERSVLVYILRYIKVYKRLTHSINVLCSINITKRSWGHL